MPEEVKRLYYDNNYARTFNATVTSCNVIKSDQYAITLDQTLFYPEGGGQPADNGKLGDATVFDVKDKDGNIVHYTDKPLAVGKSVFAEIDWQRRLELMQNHTGEHIVSGIISRIHGYNNVGFHIGSDFITLDIDGLLTNDDLEAIEAEANESIYKNIEIRAWYPSADELAELQYRQKKEIAGAIRIVNIEGYDTCACKGLHCSHTGEIGVIKIIAVQKHRSGMRLSMLCGISAMRAFKEFNISVYSISQLLAAKVGDVSHAVQNLQNENSQLKQRTNKLQEALFVYRANALDDKQICLIEEDLNPQEMQSFATILSEKAAIAAIFVKVSNDSHRYVAASRIFDIKIIGKTINEQLNGRGGASQIVAQGMVAANEQDIKTKMAEIYAEFN